jgi:two-component system response regulator GlrR
VRELANVMEGALLLATSSEIHVEDLRGLGVVPATHRPPTPTATNDLATLDDALGQLFDPLAELPALREAKDAFEREYLRSILQRAGGNVSAAARMAGRNRTDFHELLRRHGLSRAPSKPG